MSATDTRDKTPLTKAEAEAAKGAFVAEGFGCVNVVNTVPGMDRWAIMVRWTIAGALISVDTRGKVAFHQMVRNIKAQRAQG